MLHLDDLLEEFVNGLVIKTVIKTIKNFLIFFLGSALMK